MTLRIAALALALATASPAEASPPDTTTDTGLAAVVEQRLRGDSTGACFAVAVIDGDRVARTYRCAHPADEGRIGPDAAFEIGSVSKTMGAVLLADLIVQGRAALDDPLADYLPGDARVPTFEGQPILLRHLVTHTSGLPRLPANVPTDDMTDPYRDVDARALLETLAGVSLEVAPGTRFEYSNFASMLLSWALARRAGRDLESLLAERLFAPLGMPGAYIHDVRDGVRPAAGHAGDARVVSPWHFATDLAAVGGVRATLDDMVAYVQAHLGQRPSSLDAALAMAMQPVATQASQAMAMNWILTPLDDRHVHTHEGGTGGFSSYVALDVMRGRGVVVLSDTEQWSVGGLGAGLGQHLLDARLPLGGPRQATVIEPVPDDLVLADYAGEYPLAPSFVIAVRTHDDVLHAQATGQDAFALTPAGRDVFAAAAHGIEIHFERDTVGRVIALTLHQAGQMQRVERR